MLDLTLPFSKITLPKRPLSIPYEFIWALVGVVLTIGSNFIVVFAVNAPWEWFTQGIQLRSLGMTYQIGAVLLTACLGGCNAGALSQIAYLMIGLSDILPVFTKGGGWDYYQQLSFGYLLGFIPGAWLCGYLAFLRKPRLEQLALSCLGGLGGIHLCGILYLFVYAYITTLKDSTASLWLWIQQYSFMMLPGQFVIICTVTVIAYLMRFLLLY